MSEDKDGEPPRKLDAEQGETLAEVFEVVFADLSELRGSRIAIMAALTGLMAVLSRRGVLKPGDEKLVIEIAEDVSEKMQAAEAAGLDLDAFFKPRPPKKPRRKR
jgi:hypothetical protein